jgi:hypothetical protein
MTANYWHELIKAGRFLALILEVCVERFHARERIHVEMFRLE